jgi:hypothetical protein
MLTGLMQDVRYGVRLLHRQPGFAAAAIVTWLRCARDARRAPAVFSPSLR